MCWVILMPFIRRDLGGPRKQNFQKDYIDPSSARRACPAKRGRGGGMLLTHTHIGKTILSLHPSPSSPLPYQFLYCIHGSLPEQCRLLLSQNLQGDHL